MRRGFSALTVKEYTAEKKYDSSYNTITDSMYDPEEDDDNLNDTQLSLNLDQIEGW